MLDVRRLVQVRPPGGLPGRLSPGTRLVVATGLRAGRVNVGSNVAGAVVVFAFLYFVVPRTHTEADTRNLVVNLVVLAVWVPVTLVWGGLRSAEYLLRLRGWLDDGAPPGPEQRRALAYPVFALRVNAMLWLLSAVLFSAVDFPLDVALGRNVAPTILLGGIATCAVCYLLAERQVRPLAAVALAHGLPDRDAGPGVRARIVVAWFLTAALPLVAVGFIAVLPPEPLPGRATASLLFVGGLGLVVGVIAIAAVAGAIAEPIGDLRAAVARVGDGDLEASVPVYDGSEIGRLQNGFNEMVDGLRERERLRDLFGRQVGPEVAELALRQGVSLGGELRTVGVLFVDVIGSTRLAVTVPPQEVVRRLNDFFAVVVDTVTHYGGAVNKFEGDGALCVFGAPHEIPDPATSALAAARDLCARLGEAVALRAAIGVSYGVAVAGNVGSEERYEYTVIGDPVNEAARLSDVAKEGAALVASGSAVDEASDDEARRWRPDGERVVRGRDTPTRLHVLAR